MRATGPDADPVPCSGCLKPLDPLRAGHVAIFDNQLHYFCNAQQCRAAYLGLQDGEPAESAPEPLASVPPPEAAAIESAHAPVVPEDVLPELPLTSDDRALAEPVAPEGVEHQEPDLGDPPRDGSALLLLIALISATLAVLLGLSASSRLVVLSRIVLVAVGAGMLVARAVTARRDPAEPSPLVGLFAPIAAVPIALASALYSSSVIASEATGLAAAMVALSAGSAWLLDAARARVTAERLHLEAILTLETRLLTESGEEQMVSEVRSGERVLVLPGEDVPVDLVVREGEVSVLPWPFATSAVKRRVGDPIAAGAHLVQNRLVGTCTFAQQDRAFSRLLLDPRRRIDVLAPVAQAAHSLVGRWSFVAALVLSLLAYLVSENTFDVAMTFVAVQGGLGNALVGTLPGVYVARGALRAMRRGISYKSPDAWHRAGRVTSAVFSARGTILFGEPEVAEIEVHQKGVGEEDVLALAAGAARADQGPSANAVLRAAKTKGTRPEAIRNPTQQPGHGVTAVTGTGQELCVGSRTLLLSQHISIAHVEPRIAELERSGRSVVLVALGGRLVGLLALQDGIRPGARAAVQHLLDAQIEPVLMSGDSRDTCESIARALDIEHIRPEVTAAEGPVEVKRISETGERVAVIGHPQLDNSSLGAADVSVALSAAGSATAEHDVALASDDLRDAALSLALARRSRIEARSGFALAALPPALGSLLVALGVLPAVFVPIAGLLGGVVAVVHGRAMSGR